MDTLERRLAELAQAPVLLVASDYDGTLAPIVTDPSQAKPHRETVVALRSLATLPATHAAVISGRALRDLADLLGEADGVHLVGSHGSEFDLDFAHSLPEEARQLRERIKSRLKAIASSAPGLMLEEKPASIAFHFRNAPEPQAAAALEEVMSGPASLDGVFVRHGKKVVELSVVPTDKGSALECIRHRVGATAAMFIGDDITDEAAFITLTGPDVGVKVGPGESHAPHRVDDPQAVARLLAKLTEMRAAWLAGAAAVPIEHHAMLSDQRTAALLTPEARIVWLCLPRLDSPAMFSELLGGPSAGYFSIACADGATPARQRYRGQSMVLRTQWPTFEVIDFLDCSGGKNTHRPGRSDLIRIIEGKGRVVVEFAPRLEFGRGETHLKAREGGLEVRECHDPIVLRSPGVKWEIRAEGRHHTARATIELKPSKPIFLALCYGTGSLQPSKHSPSDRLVATERMWRTWARSLRLPGLARAQVLRSALALKALDYGPSGAFAAAATTSLPEHLGGVRNWDYRYCWIRDAAMTVAALAKLGSNAEAMEFLDWLLAILAERTPDRLQPVYTLSGQPLAPEAEIAELPGYAGSRPVRVGNAASRQLQLDEFAPVVELIALLIEHDAPISSEHWRLVDAMVQAVERRWTEPDHGIWEVRMPGRHHVHSKLMCWVTVDRAIRIVRHHFDRDRPDWIALRDEIAADVLDKGYRKEMNAFTAAYDSRDIDAATLQIGLKGLLPADDKRFIGTVAAVERELLNGPVVRRYRYDDGLPGIEGGFHICTAWLIEAYVRMGRIDDAMKLFEQMLALAGPTGLMSEQYDPQTGRALGNFPQAYSHIGIIETALLLDEHAG